MTGAASLLSAALAAAALLHFPRPAGGPVTQAALGMTLDGAPAVVLVAGEKVVALRADGSAVPGFPRGLGAGEVASGPPAAADLDGDGRLEIAVVTVAGNLHLFGGPGAKPVPGFPVKLGARARAGPSFVDVDGDGRPEVVVGDARGALHAFRANGREAKGWPVALGTAITSSASAARFAGGPSLAVGCADGRVHVLDLATRRARPGFPLRTGFEVTGAPAFADVDGDGGMDLAVASQDFKLYAVDAAGRALAGFPVEAGYRLYEGPAVADLDGDGRTHLAFTSADGFLHLVDGRGAEEPGFPVKLGARVFGGAAVGDLDRDGTPDLAAVASDGTVVAVRRDGAPLAGFPTRFETADLGASPLLFDLAGDGSLSLFVGFPSGEVHAIRALKFGTAVATAPWPGPARDAARTGHAATAARYQALSLEPPEPRTGDGLRARWRWAAPEAAPGEAEPPVGVEWYRDGALVADLAGRRAVPPGRARKGERWRFALVPPAGGLPARSAEVRVLDTPPTPPALQLTPERPARGQDVRAALARPSVDADGDAVAYRWEWLLDGLPTGVVGPVFPGERLRKGALLTARAVASDGEAEAEPALAEARVADSPPAALALVLEPATPRRAEPLAVRVTGGGEDADGDAVVHQHRWFVDGEPRNLPLATAALPARALRKGQKVRVEVRAFDGELEGPAAVAEAVVANGPPGAPVVELRPAVPRRGVPLRAALVGEAPDADGDALAYRWAWRKNGAPLAPGADARTVPGDLLRRGDRLQLEAWASDGEADGPHARVEAEVANTPPTAPRLALEPARPHGGEPLTVRLVTESRDADGDPVRYAYAWARDGKPIAGASAATLPAAEVRKHGRLRVTVTPSDGLEAGAPASAEVTVENALPGAPAVAFDPARPAHGAPVAVALTTPAPDGDGDRVRYRYRWRRDGFPLAVPDGGTASERAPFWTATSVLPAAEVRKGARLEVEVQAFDGEAYGPAVRLDAVVANTPPPAPRVALEPGAPRRVDALRAVVSQPPDADGDPVSHRYTWWRDGRKQDWPPEQAQVARGVARRGERWRVEVVASDGAAEAAPVAAEVVIGNTPPGAPVIALCDGAVAAGTPLAVTVREPAGDPDGDAVSYRYAWTVNGAALLAGTADGPRLAAGALRKHDRARVVVSASDGVDVGPERAAECEVANSPPGKPEIALAPAAPTALTGVRVEVRRPAPDRDGDPVAYRYAWLRDGVPAQVEGPAVAPGTLRHGETWTVLVRAFDGEEEGEPVSAAAAVVNTPPEAPAVALSPERPAAGDALRCRATSPPQDADGEPVEVRHRWLRDGQPLVLDGAQLPAGLLRRGQRWRCEAWGSDGTAESARGAAEVVVANSAPGAPQAVIEPQAPRRGDALACRVAADASDPDGDHVSYRYAWTVDGAPFPLPAGADPARVPPERLKKGQRWRCAVTPTDGALDGPVARADRTVLDTPPGPARVRVAPAAPRPGEALRCEVVQRSEDADGDRVSYAFSWWRNGEAQPFAALSEEVPARLVRAGDVWRCAVTPSDGEASGPLSGSLEVTVRGAPAPSEPVSRGP